MLWPLFEITFFFFVGLFSNLDVNFLKVCILLYLFKGFSD